MNARMKRAALCACVLALDAVLHAGVVVPKRLALYYGNPSLVEGADGSVSHAVRVLGDYDVIVFGDGLELGAESNDSVLQHEQRLLEQIVTRLHVRPRQATIYGYITLGRLQQLADAEIVHRIDAWKRLGVDGIFFDDAGRDAGVAASRRAAAVRAAHERELSVCVNVQNPDDVFDKDAGRAAGPSDLGERDALLLESFAVEHSVV